MRGALNRVACSIGRLFAQWDGNGQTNEGKQHSDTVEYICGDLERIGREDVAKDLEDERDSNEQNTDDHGQSAPLRQARRSQVDESSQSFGSVNLLEHQLT